MRTLSQRVLEYIGKHRLLRAGDRVGVAVSGGADSVALFRLLIELRPQIGIVLAVVHFNHKLRDGDSEADERFVADLAGRHQLEFHCEIGEVRAAAKEKQLSLETAARAARYEYFWRLVKENRLTRIATGHTLDDQAETVLLRVVRGAGTRGLAGIYPQLFTNGNQTSSNRAQAASIIRPLLGTRRKDLEAHLKDIGQDWREDKSNRDLRHTRNRVRHGILPRLERHLNPGVREALAETAEIARVEEEYWAREVAGTLPRFWQAGSRCLHIRPGPGVALLDQPLALQRRMVRAATESLGLRLEFRHVEEVLRVISGDANSAKSAILPHGWVVSRNKKDELRFEPGNSQPESDYEYSLALPGATEVPELGSRFEAVLVRGNAAGHDPEHLLDPLLLTNELRIRNWRAGDRFQPPHTKAAKKIKELLQERHLSGPERKLWPVVMSGGDVVWMRGFAVPSKWQPQNGAKEAAAIRELPPETQLDAEK